MQCTSCQMELRENWIACPQCGARTKSFPQCINCRHLIDHKEPAYCPYCGMYQHIPPEELPIQNEIHSEVEEVYMPPENQISLVKDAVSFKVGAISAVESSSKYNTIALSTISLFLILESIFGKNLGVTFLFWDSNKYIVLNVLGTVASFVIVYGIFISLISPEFNLGNSIRLFSISAVYGLIGFTLKGLIFLYLLSIQQTSSYLLADSAFTVDLLVLLMIFANYSIYLVKKIRVSIGASIMINLFLTWAVFLLRFVFELYYALFS